MPYQYLEKNSTFGPPSSYLHLSSGTEHIASTTTTHIPVQLPTPFACACPHMYDNWHATSACSFTLHSYIYICVLRVCSTSMSSEAMTTPFVLVLVHAYIVLVRSTCRMLYEAMTTCACSCILFDICTCTWHICSLMLRVSRTSLFHICFLYNVSSVSVAYVVTSLWVRSVPTVWLAHNFQVWKCKTGRISIFHRTRWKVVSPAAKQVRKREDEAAVKCQAWLCDSFCRTSKTMVVWIRFLWKPFVIGGQSSSENQVLIYDEAYQPKTHRHITQHTSPIPGSATPLLHPGTGASLVRPPRWKHMRSAPRHSTSASQSPWQQSHGLLLLHPSSRSWSRLLISGSILLATSNSSMRFVNHLRAILHAVFTTILSGLRLSTWRHFRAQLIAGTTVRI